MEPLSPHHSPLKLSVYRAAFFQLSVELPFLITTNIVLLPLNLMV